MDTSILRIRFSIKNKDKLDEFFQNNQMAMNTGKIVKHDLGRQRTLLSIVPITHQENPALVDVLIYPHIIMEVEVSTVMGDKEEVI